MSCAGQHLKTITAKIQSMVISVLWQGGAPQFTLEHSFFY